MKTFSIHQLRAALAITTIGTLFAVAYLSTPDFNKAPRAESATTDNVSGWVWSENIGWVSFNNTSDGSAQAYGVNVDISTKGTGGNGAITGNAWGERVGWVSFDRTKTGNPPSAPFNGGSGPVAQVDWSTGKVTGWMRALSACNQGASGNLSPTPCTQNANAGGWDGWVKLSDDTNVSWVGNGVKIIANKFGGFAWGGNVVPETKTIATFTTVGGNPRSLIFDSVGNLYTANSSTNTVYKTPPNGVSALFANVGAGPLALVFDSAGNLYTANGTASTITKIDTAGNPSFFATVGSHPNAIVIDSAGNLYTANNYTNTVSRITTLGVVSNIVVGSGPTGLAFDAAGNLYVGHVSGATSKVSKITSPGTTPSVSVFASVPDGPGDLAFDTAGNLYTGNFLANTVSKITPAQVVSTIAVPGSPANIAFDGAGNLFVANPWDDSISKVTPGGVASIFATIPGANPFDLAFDAAGNLYTANAGANTDTKITITPASDSGVVGWVDFAPKIGGISVGPVIGVPPCVAADVPAGSWGACQQIGSCPADAGSTSGIRVGACPTGGTVTQSCTTSTGLVCASAPAGSGCGDGICGVGETPLTCSKDCRVKIKRF